MSLCREQERYCQIIIIISLWEERKIARPKLICSKRRFFLLETNIQRELRLLGEGLPFGRMVMQCEQFLRTAFQQTVH